MKANDDADDGADTGSSSAQRSGSGAPVGSAHTAAFAGYARALTLAHDADIVSTQALAELGRSALREARRDSIRGMASDMELRSVAAEAAGMARLTDRRLQSDIDHALTIVDDYPSVFDAWRSRVIERGHVDQIVKVGSIVPEAVRPAFEDAAIAVCERDIPSRVKDALRALADHLHPRSFTERHREAASGRCVRVLHSTDGMSDLIATLPTVIATGMLDRLTQMGQSIKDSRRPGIAFSIAAADGDAAAGAGTAGDGANAAGAGAAGADTAGADAGSDDAVAEASDVRTMDQLRADVLSDLVLAGAPVVDPKHGADRGGSLGAIRAHVQVVITAATLAGDDERPAEAVGAGLVDAPTVRHLAGQTAEWDRLFIDPVTRTPVEVDQYRPIEPMRRLLQTRDQHCRFPGCRRAAIRCEIDHTIDWALGGHTHIFNLAHLCQRHHSMKQFTKWQVRQVGGGVLEWTSPLGRVYREDVPIPAVCFVTETGTSPPDISDRSHASGPPAAPPF